MFKYKMTNSLLEEQKSDATKYICFTPSAYVPTVYGFCFLLFEQKAMNVI